MNFLHNLINFIRIECHKLIDMYFHLVAPGADPFIQMNYVAFAIIFI